MSNRRFVDLHTHSTASDGSLSPAEVVRLADRAHLAAVAHDASVTSPAEIKFANYVEYGRRFERLLADIRQKG